MQDFFSSFCIIFKAPFPYSWSIMFEKELVLSRKTGDMHNFLVRALISLAVGVHRFKGLFALRTTPSANNSSWSNSYRWDISLQFSLRLLIKRVLLILEYRDYSICNENKRSLMILYPKLKVNENKSEWKWKYIKSIEKLKSNFKNLNSKQHLPNQ